MFGYLCIENTFCYLFAMPRIESRASQMLGWCFNTWAYHSPPYEKWSCLPVFSPLLSCLCLFNILKLKFHLFVFIWVCVCHGAHKEIIGQLRKIHSLLPCGAPGSNSGCQDESKPLPTEPFGQPSSLQPSILQILHTVLIFFYLLAIQILKDHLSPSCSPSPFYDHV